MGGVGRIGVTHDRSSVRCEARDEARDRLGEADGDRPGEPEGDDVDSRSGAGTDVGDSIWILCYMCVCGSGAMVILSCWYGVGIGVGIGVGRDSGGGGMGRETGEGFIIKLTAEPINQQSGHGLAQCG